MPRERAEIESAVRACVEQCRNDPIARQCAFNYVRRLLNNDGWSAEDAGQVWQLSIQELDGSAGPSAADTAE